MKACFCSLRLDPSLCRLARSGKPPSTCLHRSTCTGYIHLWKYGPPAINLRRSSSRYGQTRTSIRSASTADMALGCWLPPCRGSLGPHDALHEESGCGARSEATNSTAILDGSKCLLDQAKDLGGAVCGARLAQEPSLRDSTSAQHHGQRVVLPADRPGWYAPMVPLLDVFVR